MLKLILTVWILVEAIRRKYCRWIPVCVLMALYWAADAGFLRLSEFLSMAGTIKRLILLVLTVLLFLLWRKKEANGAALIFCLLAVLSRFVWKMIANRYLDAMLQPDANYLTLAITGAASMGVFNVVTDVLLLAAQVMIIRKLLRTVVDVPQNNPETPLTKS